MAILRVLPADIELPVHEGEAMLPAICRDGFTYRFGCRRGGCGVCKADLESGEVTYQKTVADSVLSAQERAEGVVLTCRALLASDEVTIRMRPESRLKKNFPGLFAIAQREVAEERRRKLAEKQANF
jgi:ferredoxin